jgi:hypothetical protein
MGAVIHGWRAETLIIGGAYSGQRSSPGYTILDSSLFLSPRPGICATGSRHGLSDKNSSRRKPSHRWRVFGAEPAAAFRGNGQDNASSHASPDAESGLPPTSNEFVQTTQACDAHCHTLEDPAILLQRFSGQVAKIMRQGTHLQTPRSACHQHARHISPVPVSRLFGRGRAVYKYMFCAFCFFGYNICIYIVTFINDKKRLPKNWVLGGPRKTKSLRLPMTDELPGPGPASNGQATSKRTARGNMIHDAHTTPRLPRANKHDYHYCAVTKKVRATQQAHQPHAGD